MTANDCFGIHALPSYASYRWRPIKRAPEKVLEGATTLAISHRPNGTRFEYSGDVLNLANLPSGVHDPFFENTLVRRLALRCQLSGFEVAIHLDDPSPASEAPFMHSVE
jgi:hypothetical protein